QCGSETLFPSRTPRIGEPTGDAFQLWFPQRTHHGSDSILRFPRLARLETHPEPRRAFGLCSGCLLLDPAHRTEPDSPGSPLPDRRSRRAGGRSLLAGLLLDSIRNLALARRLSPVFQAYVPVPEQLHRALANFGID